MLGGGQLLGEGGRGLGWVVGMSGTAGGGLYFLLGLFRVAVSPRSTSYKPIEGLRDISLTLGPISDPYFPSSTLHGPHCLNRDFTWLAKLALEKLTS